MKEIVIVIVVFVLGALIGAMAAYARYHTKPSGTLRVVHGDEEQPYLFLELEDAKGIRHEQVSFKVSHENYTQK